MPEAQLDRFMFCLKVDYPEFEDEVDILLATTQDSQEEVRKIVTAEEILEMQAAIRQIPVPRSVAEFATPACQGNTPQPR